MNGSLSHIEIYVSNIHKTIEFWEWLLTEKFDYSIFQKWDAGISFKFEKTYIVFVQVEEKFLQSSYNRKNIGLNHLAFHCDSKDFIDELTNDLKARKFNILYSDKHPYAAGNNIYGVYFEDPDRIKVEVIVYE